MKCDSATAVRAMYRDYGRAMYAVAYRVLGRADLAEDATQQAFVRAWQAAGRFDADRAAGPWLRTITRTVAIDIARREVRRQVTVLGTDVEKPPRDALDAVWRVRRAIDALPDEEAEIVRLQHLEGLKQHEIARALDLPLGTVKSRAHRAHRRLTRILGHSLAQSATETVPVSIEWSAAKRRI